MQHSHSSTELLGAPPAHSSQKRTCTLGSGSWKNPSSSRSSGQSRGCGSGLYLQKGVCLWAWVLLWALVAPGACGMTADMEEVIVELHNFYRGQVFPSATAMMPLKWDNSLQVLAGSYVTQCIWQHNPLLADTGENLFVTEGTLDIQIALEQWFMEHLNYNYDNNSCPEDKMCGHYTQMVWADSHRVGCEVHSCDVMQGLQLGPSQFLVCNYYPAGNYEDQKPYEEGDWCSRCPEDLKKCENHLCVPDEEEEDEGEDDDDEDTTILPHVTSEPPIGYSPSSATEALPLTPSQDTPPAAHSSPAEAAAPTAGGEEETVEEDLKEEEKQGEELREESQLEEEPIEEEYQEEEEPKGEVQRVKEQKEEEPKGEVQGVKEQKEQEPKGEVQGVKEQKEEEPKGEVQGVKEQKEQERREEGQKVAGQKEVEQREKEQREKEQREKEQREETKLTKAAIETKWETKKESIAAGCRVTSCFPYDSFLLLCGIVALALRL